VRVMFTWLILRACCWANLTRNGADIGSVSRRALRRRGLEEIKTGLLY